MSIAVSITERHLERSCVRSHAELRPRLVGCRSDSMVYGARFDVVCLSGGASLRWYKVLQLAAVNKFNVSSHSITLSRASVAAELHDI